MRPVDRRTAESYESQPTSLRNPEPRHLHVDQDSLHKARQLWTCITSFCEGEDSLLQEFKSADLVALTKDRVVDGIQFTGSFRVDLDHNKALGWLSVKAIVLVIQRSLLSVTMKFQTFQVFTADGEPSEQLCPYYLSKLGGMKLCAVYRCHAHSSQKALEKAIESDPRAQELVGTLVNNYAKDKTNPGGFARAVKNAPRLASMYASNIAEIDGILSKAYKTKSMSFAAQRFDSIMQITQTVIYHLVPIMNTLSELQVKDAALRPWCQGLLKCLSPDRLILVALLAELSRCAAGFVHRHDASQRSNAITSLAESAKAFGELRAELNRLFFWRDSEGRLQEPLVLDCNYCAGYLQLLLKNYNMCVSKAGQASV